jgi:hypothetical protein
MVPWWNEELSHLKALIRWLFNKAKKTGDCPSYRTALTCYNIKRSEKPNGPLGGTTVGGLRMYPTGLDPQGS